MTKEERVKLRKEHLKGEKMEKLLFKFRISKKTFERIIEEENLEKIPNGGKKASKGLFPEIEALVVNQFDSFRKRGLSISGPSIQLLAEKFKQSLLKTDLSEERRAIISKATFGKSWLEGFKRRYNIRQIRVNGERNSVPENINELMEPIENLIDTLEMPPSDIYNFDETGLFYRALPQYTLAKSNDTGGGLKQEKKRITAAFLVNATGTDKKLLLIGKSKTPKNTSIDYFSIHNITYAYNNTAWMNEGVFNKYLLHWDQELTRTVLLLVDNFSGHELTQEFKNIIVVFLPKNSTSKTQPLDAGLISTFKTFYRSSLLSYLMARIESIDLGDITDFSMNEITLHRIVPWIQTAWEALKPSTIIKCWKKCVRASTIKSIQIASDERSQEEQAMENLRLAMEKLLQADVTIEEAQLYGDPKEEEEYLEPDSFDVESDEETIKIPDQQHVSKCIDVAINYFVSTNQSEQVTAARFLKRSILNDLAFNF